MKIGPTRWVKSSYSSAEGGNCLEWSPASAAANGPVPVRDSKNPEGPVLSFPPNAFAGFIAHVKARGFDA